MQALLLTPDQPDVIRVINDHTEPTPADGEVLIRVTLAGICATDLEIAKGYMGFTGIPGHEFVGIVERGPAELLNQRVVGEINCPCNACELCRAGLGNHCPNRTVLGIAGRDGAFAEYLNLPAANCHVVPTHLSDEQAVLTELLAAAVHVVDACTLTPDMRVTVLGAGRLGLLCAAAVAAHGPRPCVVDRNANRLKLARQWGLDTIPLDQLDRQPNQDVVVECTGSSAGLALAIELTRPAGTIVLKTTSADRADIDLAPIVIHELRIVGNRCGPFAAALDLLARDRVCVTDLISATYPLSQGADAFAAARQPDHLKILIRPGES